MICNIQLTMICCPAHQVSTLLTTSEGIVVTFSQFVQFDQLCPKLPEYLNMSAPYALCVKVYWPFEYWNALLS